jgi:hypothetical protein
MGNLLLLLGRIAGVAGILLCTFAIAARAVGIWTLHGFQVGTVLQLGMAVMIAGSLGYCADFAERARK